MPVATPFSDPNAIPAEIERDSSSSVSDHKNRRKFDSSKIKEMGFEEKCGRWGKSHFSADEKNTPLDPGYADWNMEMDYVSGFRHGYNEEDMI